MKGTIVGTWVNTSRHIWGDELTNQAMKFVDWPTDKIFTPTEEIADEKPQKFAKYIAEQLDKSEEEVWLEIGKDNTKTFFKAYPAFFLKESLYAFLRSLYDIHTVMVKRIAGANPPEVTIQPISSDEAILHYRSKRGMFGYFKGLLAGAAEHYNEPIEVQVISSSAEHLDLKIKFPQPIIEEHRFAINQVLAFGVLKSISAKAGLLTAILFAGLEAILHVFNIAALPFWLIPLVGIVAWASTSILLRPIKYISAELQNLINHSYQAETKFVSEDEFEEIIKLIEAYKTKVKRDFVGFKGISDEMNNYADTFNTLSQRMRETSQDISGVVYDVATAAANQATETEASVEIVTGNLEMLKVVVQEQNRNKQGLEAAIAEINKGFADVRTTSGRLAASLQNFAKVQKSAENLKEQATKINEITEMVAAIAGQTNLLALNAAIEAARAGEQGRGFAVVAEEVRKLAEQSQEHSESISNDLQVLINIISSVVDLINKEYLVLETEGQQLDEVVANNSSHIENVHRVAENIVDMIDKLESEMAGLNQVSGKIEGLAAISEENSAASEEVSAAVQVYNEKLQDMMQKISDFKTVIEQFSDDMNQYHT